MTYFNQPFNSVCMENFTRRVGDFTCCGDCVPEDVAFFGLWIILLGLPLLCLMLIALRKRRDKK